MNDNWVTATVMDDMFDKLAVVRTEEELMMARVLEGVYRIDYTDVNGNFHREDGPAVEWPRYPHEGMYCWHGKNFDSLASLKKWVSKQTRNKGKRRIK